jgi:hypothetical protein
MPGKCSFREEWLSESNLKWLRPVEGDKYKASCLLCKSKFDVSHSGFASLKTHAKGKKHSDLANGLLTGQQKTLSFASKPASDPSYPVAVPSTSAGSSASEVKIVPEERHLHKFLVKENVMRAEIIWAMYRVLSQSSDRSSAKACNLFSYMFPDSLIAEKFAMQKDKLAYSITYGLGPYFQEKLCSEVSKRQFFCIGMDESLNKIAHKSQMDLIVRYWGDSEEMVCTRYLTSVFLGHTTASDILKGFLSAISDLGLSLQNILQVEMDGPNVNLKFFRELQLHLKSLSSQASENSLIDLGTCVLHIVHGAYKTAHGNCGWNINKFLRSIYYHFKDFPSRRADYIFHTNSNIFPLKMCSIRWVENAGVIERALKILPFLKKYIDAVSAKPPQSGNFETMKQFLSDELLPAKLAFLQSVAMQLEPFLTLFQADKPLLPFLYSEYYHLINSIAHRFVRKAAMDKINNARHISELNVDDINNLKKVREVDIGFAAVNSCKSMKEGAVLTFRRECRQFFILLFKKLNQKSPLNNAMVKGASCLSPAVMLSSMASSRINIAIQELIQRGVISGIIGDSIKRTYFSLIENEHVKLHLKTFVMQEDRLDVFLMKIKNFVDIPLKDIQLFSLFMPNIFILFHGNAAVERSFSANKELLVDNLHEQSLVSLRSVHSAIIAAGDIRKIDISKALISAFCSSSAKRKAALEEKRAKEAEDINSVKNAQKKIKELTLKKRMLELQAEEETNALQTEINEIRKKMKPF